MKTELHNTHQGHTHLPHVVVLMGGMSVEREVSLASAKGIIEALVNANYTVTPIDMGRDVAEIIYRLKPDVVFNALHGTHGEDGCVPGMLEILGIPYTHSGVLASAVGLEKRFSQKLLMSHGVKCPERIFVNKDDQLDQDPMPRPYVIKPIDQGSSFGVEVVFKEDDFKFSDYKFEYGDTVIVERYIPGREFDVAVINGKALGICEIVTKGRRFRDFTAKYQSGFSEFLIPAPLSEERSRTLMNISEKACEILHCGEVARAEFKYDENGDGEFYFLELNTHPGFTPMSIVPRIAKAQGISFDELVKMLLDNAINKNKRKELINA